MKRRIEEALAVLFFCACVVIVLTVPTWAEWVDGVAQGIDASAPAAERHAQALEAIRCK